MVKTKLTIRMGERVLIDGINFFGEHDYNLIKKYGIENLNFNPATPPQYR